MARPKVKSQIVAGRQAHVVKVTPEPAAFRSCIPSSAGASFRRLSIVGARPEGAVEPGSLTGSPGTLSFAVAGSLSGAVACDW